MLGQISHRLAASGPPVARAACGYASKPRMHKLRFETASHIDLEEIDRLLFRAAKEQLWLPPGGRGVFGGQILGQALHAATRAVAQSPGPGWAVHSLHGYFLQAGDPRRDVLYRVRETSERRSFATRNVDAMQDGTVIFKMSSSFARAAPADARQPEHQAPYPDGVPDPESLPSMREAIDALLPRLPAGRIRDEVLRLLATPVDLRFVDEETDPLDPDPRRRPPRRKLWIRVDAIDRRATDAGVDACAAAYTSDHALLTTALLPHGLQLPSPRMGAVASLDHSMWFHAPFRADDWMLYDIHAPRLNDARGLAIGSLYQDGKLCVTCAQEGLLRLAKPTTTRAAATWAMRARKLVEDALVALNFKTP